MMNCRPRALATLGASLRSQMALDSPPSSSAADEPAQCPLRMASLRRTAKPGRPGAFSRGTRGPWLALSTQVLGTRRSLPLAAFLIGVGVALTVGLVISSFLQSREEAKQRYLQTTKTEVRMLAGAVDMNSKPAANQPRKVEVEQIRKAVLELWLQAGHWIPAADKTSSSSTTGIWTSF